MKTALIIFAGTVNILLTLPIWFYILYQILKAIHATDIVWLLYWLYIPAIIIASAISNIIAQLAQNENED